jgi:hypothetical protein
VALVEDAARRAVARRGGEQRCVVDRHRNPYWAGSPDL